METRLSEFKKNIVLWYPFKNNSKILNLNDGYEAILDNLDVEFDKIVSINDSSFDKDEKYDYITIFGKYTYEFEDKIKKAVNYLKDDGKILIALDNKFGLKNWNESRALENDISEKTLNEIFNKYSLDNKKFYYVYPNYKQANLIYSKDYEMTEEDITRNFEVYSENAIVCKNEKETFKRILEEGNEVLNQYANSFFIEVSKNAIDTDVKYVTYSNYRKPEYRTMTIIKSDEVIKKSVDEISLPHMKNIINNLELLKQIDVVTIENIKNNTLISKFIDTPRFDAELESSSSVEDFMDKIKILTKVLEKNVISYSNVDKSKLRNSISNYDDDKLEKMRFIENAFIDLVPKNCFIVEGKLNIFDQEWIEKNIPLEFIYYRLILNTPICLNKFGKEKMFEAFGIVDYIDLFEQIENEIRDQIIDKEIIDMFFRTYIPVDLAEKQRNIFREKSFELQEKVEQLEAQNQGLQLELEDARGKLVDYANQLRVISNSGSWKIIQKLRSLVQYITFRKKINWFDVFYPVGSEKRNRYEQKQAELKEKQRIQNMVNSTDKDTADYWLELENRIQIRRNELAEEELEADSDPYEFWIKSNDPSKEELENQKCVAATFANKPLISIVVPLYNTNIVFFKELLFTLYHQTYTNWELCLADGSPEKLVEIEKICNDPRIKYHYIGENKGISGNTNEALKLVSGDFVALLDHDDLLPLNALFEVVNTINQHPEVEFIYSDEDKIEEIDKPRYDPHFKPDYAPDFFLSGNYICHFSVFRKDLIDKLEGFRSEYDGAQDFDIILRATEFAKEENIIHIPKILYHWRVHKESTAANIDAKSYAVDAGTKAIQDHLIRMKSNGIAKRDEKINNFYQVVYPIDGNPKVNIYIVNYLDSKYYLNKCIESIIKNTTYSNYEIIIVDSENKSDEIELYYKEIENNKKIFIIRFENNSINDKYSSQEEKYLLQKMNYSKAMNYAVSNTKSDMIVELDLHEEIITGNWLEVLIGFAQRNDVGCVGAKTLYSDGTIKNAGIAYGIGDYALYLYKNTFNGHRVRDKMICNMSCLSSLCRMYRREVFEEVNGMNENIHFETINEIDFSFRIRNKNYLMIYTPQVELLDRDLTDKRERVEDEEQFAYRKEIKELKANWKEVFDKPDKYHNINFSPISSNCVVRIDKV